MMKLAEALLERANMQKDLARLESRITDNVLVQEGDEPAEDPSVLMKTFVDEVSQLEKLIQRINATNGSSQFAPGETIADAIVRRDMLARQLEMYRRAYQQAQVQPNRISNSEIRFVRCVQPADLQKQIDSLSKQYRELDTALQAMNWQVDLQ